MSTKNPVETGLRSNYHNQSFVNRWCLQSGTKQIIAKFNGHVFNDKTNSKL